ncbi:helix-turn-helix domain-containing protein [Myxococcus sp. Y35]|uniref:helix-turn-helix domain-containing protein n=1 Tax=Pseudomyxococcus flavus TaxID=3115648 RepID=UPI003CEEAA0E
MKSTPLLCSFREAAKLLGVGRNSTLPGLIARGVLRPVTVAGRRYIPREQLKHLARHGEAPAETTPPPKRRRAASSLRDLKL